MRASMSFHRILYLCTVHWLYCLLRRISNFLKRISKRRPNMQAMKSSEETSTLLMKVFSALFFVSSSLMITVVNKTILTVYKFPCYQVLALGQMAATVVALWLARCALLVKFPPLDSGTVRRIWPLPLVFLGNLATGLGGTKELNIPMFTVLRRLTILLTMVLERIILGIEASCAVQCSVMGMVIGAVVAASDDLTFTWIGYLFVLLNDVFSAANGVYLKKILDNKELDMVALLYYDSFFMLLPVAFMAWVSGEFGVSADFVSWFDLVFLCNFVISCVMGLVVSYSVMLCTKHNSALTTAVIGSLKSALVTYLGILIMGDYIYSWLNFVGLNISVISSLFYTYISFREKSVAYSLVTSSQEDTV